MFNPDIYHQNLSTQWLGHDLLYFEELESTNSHVKKLSSEEISHGLLCLADYQTEGRGQYEKNWVSERGENLTFTLAFLPGQAKRLHVLTLACARAIIRQLEETTGLEGAIKWPNDVCLDGRKVAGLLTETTFSGNKIDRLLVGIGLNVNQDHFPDDIRDSAASIKQLTGKQIERELLMAELMSHIEYEYRRWQKQERDQLRQINQNLIGYGRWVRLSINGRVSDNTAKLIGVNEDGQLVVLTQDAELKTYSFEQIRIITDED
ncbi:MAG: biotin--[acetyl-CoA-carboxylase] ligase [Balneolaceae bacterium]|nr:biotin--[acetyl-CoA-carboxylase] ligase [Balneolaceae bacterium]